MFVSGFVLLRTTMNNRITQDSRTLRPTQLGPFIRADFELGPTLVLWAG